MMTSFLQVAIGGAIGSCLRFGVGILMLRLAGPVIPLGVLTVNIVGSFLMGVVMVLSFHRGLEYLNPFLMTGILGGFTTFSAFSMEAFTLYERGQIGAAAAYVVLSVGLSIGAFVLGALLTRAVIA